MKLLKHVESILMPAFFLLCALGALQIGAPRHSMATMANIATVATMATAATTATNATMTTVYISSAEAAASEPTDVRTASPASLPILVPMPTPMPVVHIIGRRMTDAEKRAAAASAG